MFSCRSGLFYYIKATNESKLHFYLSLPVNKDPHLIPVISFSPLLNGGFLAADWLTAYGATLLRRPGAVAAVCVTLNTRSGLR